MMKDRTRINRFIRVPQVRLIDENGEQLGVVATDEALRKSETAGLDLVEVAPNTKPPVCRIMDYSRYKYEQEKKAKLAKKKQRVTHVKEVKFGPNIEEHDYQFKLQHMEKFLKRGDKVKVTMVFRGRQMAHIDVGRKVFNRLAGDVVSIGEIEKNPKLEGRAMTMVVTPKK